MLCVASTREAGEATEKRLAGGREVERSWCPGPELALGRSVVNKRECSASCREPVDLGATAYQPVHLWASHFEAVRDAQMLLWSIQFRPSVLETISKHAAGARASLHRRTYSVAGSMTRERRTAVESKQGCSAVAELTSGLVTM